MRKIRNHVKSVEKKTSKALRQFSAIETELQGQNEAIGTLVTEIDEEIERLVALRGAATMNRRTNDGIIKRVREFLSE